MSAAARLPLWLKPANRVIIALQRLGLVIGTMRVLSLEERDRISRTNEIGNRAVSKAPRARSPC
jgi:hypothetical protein